MIVLKLWSDIHRRTPVDVFVYEPFDFAKKYAASRREKVTANVKAPVVSLKTLLKMKRAAGRHQDLADIADMERIEELKKLFAWLKKNFMTIPAGVGAPRKERATMFCFSACKPLSAKSSNGWRRSRRFPCNFARTVENKTQER